MVEAILAIKPETGKEMDKERLTYAQDISNASHFFADLGNDLMKPDDLNDDDWEQKRVVLSRKSLSEWKRIMWVYL
jgi:hypothetical protein